jgi:hypothetical protein
LPYDMVLMDCQRPGASTRAPLLPGTAGISMLRSRIHNENA